ncbi:enoyl-CoA hydratase [Azohydromonas caseinilytica]|uniref:Enoyl-CoA hydratase n=1 Tax=Azohydromonas caseinilytica TaxID=2728836 RepID=A0A848F7X0_9BURK|nr:enoyl-CoA hydratase [Azohydromonas caseinilytica]NML15278.1 enoyl-CoA hydratase [Azohydromonas caseinilytica]
MSENNQADEGRVRLALHEGVAEVVFDRPAARNAMTWAMYEALDAICARLALDPSVRVVLFRGAGGQAFVAGTDIAQFRDFSAGEDGVTYERRIDALIDRVASLPMPTLALVEGFAVGGGLAIATACDFRLATPDARFGVPIARTLGNCLSMANVARLRDAFGSQRVKRMLLLAELLGAEEARACGFLHGVHAREDIEAQARALCTALAALAPVTQAVAKEALRRLALAAVPDGDDLVRRCYGSGDFREGVAAFTERRAPRWRGE